MVELLSKIREIFGYDLNQGQIQEALLYILNQRSSQIGNSVLDLCDSLFMYDSDSFSNQIDDSRQVNFSRNRHRDIVNSDKEFVDYIIKYD